MTLLQYLRSFFIRTEPRKYNFLREYCKVSSQLCDTEENLRKNPYFDKYAEKISTMRQISPDKFKVMLEDNIKDAQIKLPPKSKAIDNINSIKSENLSHFKKQKDLNQIMKLDAIKDKSASEIECIWKDYHMIKDGIYAVLPRESFEKMNKNFQEFPVFIFPLPRAEGYEFILLQFLDKSCYFTSLINYQAHKENAPVVLTVTYFSDLQVEKGIVLMRGEYDNTSLKAHEAQCLTNQLYLYYGSNNDEKIELLKKFNNYPDTFKHMDLISNFESSLGQ